MSNLLNRKLTFEEQEALRRRMRRSLAIIAMRFKLVPRLKGGKVVWSGRHACHVRITGRVQGVFFRAWTRDRAKALNIAGWVRNCDDGSVEAQIEGSRDSIETLIAHLHEGPSTARVEEVRVSGADVEGLRSFEVRH